MFITQFSDEEILEYRFSMSDEEFQGWFNRASVPGWEEVNVIGYVSVAERSWKQPYRDFIPYLGKHRMMMVVKRYGLYQVLDVEMGIISELRPALLGELIKNNVYSLQIDGHLICRLE